MKIKRREKKREINDDDILWWEPDSPNSRPPRSITWYCFKGGDAGYSKQVHNGMTRKAEDEGERVLYVACRLLDRRLGGGFSCAHKRYGFDWKRS